MTRIAIVLSLFTLLLRAQEPTADPDLSCFSSLELPTRGLFAAGAGTSGSVIAAAEIGRGGKLSKLRLTGGNPGLQGEVRVAMNLSQFAAKCHGQTVKVVFGFILEDPPIDHIIPPGVRFVPPNRFELVFRRVKPSYDPAPSSKDPK